MTRRMARQSQAHIVAAAFSRQPRPLFFSLGFAANNLYNKPRENRVGAAVMPQGGECAILGRDIATACKKAT